MEKASQAFAGNTIVAVIQGPKLTTGTPLVSGFIEAGALIPRNFRIPYRDSLKKTGYQRPPQKSRINELATDLRLKRTDLPTAVLLNIRERSVRDAVRRDDSGVLRLDLGQLVQHGSNPCFYVVDGQHRVLALEKLIEEEPEKWTPFMIPFVCMLGADEDEEMDQFYTVNSKAKSVRTDLAYALLKERADRNSGVYDALLERGREWQVDGQRLVERLSESSSVWKRRVRFPAMDKEDTTISNTSLVASLKPLLTDSPLFKRSSIDQRLKILDAYWQGVRLSMREPFDHPTEYSVQKGIGAIVMHEVLPDVIELIRSRGGSILEPESFHEVLAPALAQLEGDDGNGDPVKGTDFWRSGVAGASGSFSSSAGRRVLAAKLRQLLPNIEIDSLS